MIVGLWSSVSCVQIRFQSCNTCNVMHILCYIMCTVFSVLQRSSSVGDAEALWNVSNPNNIINIPKSFCITNRAEPL